MSKLVDLLLNKHVAMGFNEKPWMSLGQKFSYGKGGEPQRKERKSMGCYDKEESTIYNCQMSWFHELQLMVFLIIVDSMEISFMINCIRN